jgi:hypothetical protein
MYPEPKPVTSRSWPRQPDCEARPSRLLPRSLRKVLRRAGSDRRVELRLGSRAAGERTEDRQVDPGAAVCFNPLAAMLWRSSDAGGIDQCIANRTLCSVPIAMRAQAAAIAAASVAKPCSAIRRL